MLCGFLFLKESMFTKFVYFRNVVESLNKGFKKKHENLQLLLLKQGDY
jgi:hypothetical protein